MPCTKCSLVGSLRVSESISKPEHRPRSRLASRNGSAARAASVIGSGIRVKGRIVSILGISFGRIYIKVRWIFAYVKTIFVGDSPVRRGSGGSGLLFEVAAGD